MAVRIENVRGKTKKHQYEDKDGLWLPGTTTVTDLLGPVGGLGYWGFEVGKSGEVDDYWAYMNGLASAGTAAHAVIEGYLTGARVDTSAFTGQELAIADSCLRKFHTWAAGKDITLIYSERPLVSETFKYGGQLDFYLKVDGLYTIVDLKTAKEVRLSMKVQTAAYKQLVVEAGEPVDQVIVLATGRDDDDPLQKWSATNTQVLWEIFEHLLGIYRLSQADKKPTPIKDASLEAQLRASIELKLREVNKATTERTT